mgnify:FL=1
MSERGRFADGVGAVVGGVAGTVSKTVVDMPVAFPDLRRAELVSSEVVHCHQLYSHTCSTARCMSVLFANGVKPHSCDSERNDFYSAAAE